MAILDDLLMAARAARVRAYAPYSGFAVGAAVAAGEDEVFAGCNVENASYPVGTCAEAGAIAAMVAAGHRRLDAILVLAEGPDLVTPCGACRQRIREFASDMAIIHIADPRGVRACFTVAELLPQAFGPAGRSPEPRTERKAVPQ